ncbi:MAG: type I restriction enzyme HsdR N-terminal domain-containing protein [Deltaproteobacteria bacterium]|nr:type I restriction enzyme HsdR N-terminal domain-containing protein [Deltaproteobacteria bacterium]
MARETKEERVIRTMIPQLTEHIIELKHLTAISPKESHIENWCQSLLKTVLGFSASAGYQVRTQEARGTMRFDIVVSKAEKPEQLILVAEVKRLGADLNRSDLRSGKLQLKEYLASVGNVPWGILTNGYEWRLYDFNSDALCIATTDIRNDQQQLATTPREIEETAWDFIDFSAFYFENKTWDKLSAEAQAFSPDSLARSILSNDIVKKIARNLKGEHDYRVPLDVLTDKLA